MGSSMAYLALMTGCGSLVAVGIQLIRRHPLSEMVRLPRKVMVSGFFGVALYTVLLAKAFGMAAGADIGQINLLNYLWPVWMVVLSILLLGNRPKLPLAAGGILLGLTGVIISRGFDSFTYLPANLIPHIFALVGGFLWALYVVLLRKWNISDKNGGTTFHFAVCAIIAAGCAAIGGEWQRVPAFSGKMLFWILLGGIGPVGIAYSLYEISVKNGPVILIASFAYFIPIGSSLLIGLFFKESLTSGLLLGAVCITLGAWLVHHSCRHIE